MKPKGVIVMYPHAASQVYGDDLLTAFAGRVDLLSPVISRETLAARPGLLAETEVIFSSWGAPVMDESFLATAAKLRAIFYAAGTVRSWATEAVWRRNLTVSSAYAANAQPVSEYTVATILFSLKNGWRHALGAKRQGCQPARIQCAGAYGSKVGLISLGTIARRVRALLRTFDVEVLAYDPFLTTPQADALGVKRVSLEQLFKECDVISLHSPLLPETAELVTGRHFESMKLGATFINTARGEIVRENELIDVFTRRSDLTAVLDVTHPEPPVAGSPLYTLPNIVLTPHIAGSLDHECHRLGQTMLDEFDRWAKGEPLHWQITREKAATMA